MNRQNLLIVLLAVMAVPVALAGCSFGGSDSASAAEHIEATATPVPSSTAPATPAPGTSPAVAPTATPSGITGTSTTTIATPIPQPLAYVDALVSASPDGTAYDVTVTIDVARRGVSAVDLVARVSGTGVVVESVSAGPLLGSTALVAIASADEDSADVALARAGGSDRENVSGVVAVLRVNAGSPEAVRAGLSLSLSFTDAGLVLHGPFEAAFDIGDDR
jgi:hypothetical protein